MNITRQIERVGHIRHLPPTFPYVYIGRTMPRYRLKDTGWGNPFRKGVNSADPVNDYEAYLLRRSDLMARLPELVGHDLLCWCRKPGNENYGTMPRSFWVCHGDVLLARVRRWEEEHPTEAAAIRAQLSA